MLKFASLIAIVLMTIVLCGSYSGNNMAAANLKEAPDVAQLFMIADKLERGLSDKSVREEAGFRQRVKEFVSLPTGEVVQSKLRVLNSHLAAFQVAAKEFVNNFGASFNVFRLFNNEQNKAYTAAKGRAELTQLLDDYKKRLSLRLEVTRDDIDCDLDVLQMTQLHRMIFVLQVDIKYLIAERPAVVVRAIAEQIKGANYMAKHEQYNNLGATKEQTECLKKLYFGVVLANTKKLQDAVNQYEYTNPLVLGRLADTCSTLQQFMKEYERLNKVRAEHCEKSEMAKDPTRQKVIHTLKEFEHEIEFCEKFLNARAPAPSS